MTFTASYRLQLILNCLIVFFIQQEGRRTLSSVHRLAHVKSRLMELYDRPSTLQLILLDVVLLYVLQVHITPLKWNLKSVEEAVKS